MQQLQDVKIVHTFKIMITSMHKHFDPWLNRHLPLALFGEQPIAQTVASFLLDISHQPVVYESKIHDNRKIDVGRLAIFIRQRCTTKSTIKLIDKITQNIKKSI